MFAGPSSKPHVRHATVKKTRYQPEKRLLHATLQWSLESADARDEIRQTLDKKKYKNALPRRREQVTTVKWALESSDAREQVRQVVKARHREPSSLPEYLPKNLHDLPVPEIHLEWGTARFSPPNLLRHISPPLEVIGEWEDDYSDEERISPIIEDNVPEQIPDSPEMTTIRATPSSAKPLNTLAYTLPPPPYGPAEPSLPMEALIAQAIQASHDQHLSLRDISAYVTTVYPYYKDDVMWMKRLWRKLSTAYFVTLPRDKEAGRKVNLYGIAEDSQSCFIDGGFTKRQVKRKRKEPSGGQVQAKRRKVLKHTSVTPETYSPDEYEYEETYFPPASMPGSPTRSMSPPPGFMAAPRSFYLSTDKPLKPSFSLPPRSMSRSPSRSLSPPPDRPIRIPAPARRPFQLSAAQPLRPSSSLPSIAAQSPRRLVPVHSWHQPAAYRTVLSRDDMHEHTQTHSRAFSTDT